MFDEVRPDPQTKQFVSLRLRVVEYEQPLKKTHWRRQVVCQDQNQTQCEITFWNGYATRPFQVNETLLVVRAEASMRQAGSEARRQMNVWFDAMILPCTGELADLALPA